MGLFDNLDDFDYGYTTTESINYNGNTFNYQESHSFFDEDDFANQDKKEADRIYEEIKESNKYSEEMLEEFKENLDKCISKGIRPFNEMGEICEDNPLALLKLAIRDLENGMELSDIQQYINTSTIEEAAEERKGMLFDSSNYTLEEKIEFGRYDVYAISDEINEAFIKGKEGRDDQESYIFGAKKFNNSKNNIGDDGAI